MLCVSLNKLEDYMRKLSNWKSFKATNVILSVSTSNLSRENIWIYSDHQRPFAESLSHSLLARGQIDDGMEMKVCINHPKVKVKNCRTNFYSVSSCYLTGFQ